MVGKICELLPDKFALVFDGLSYNQTHYLAIFVTFPDESEIVYVKVLHVFSPFEV